MELTSCTSVEEFRKLILSSTGVAVCHREHFGSAQPGEKEKYVRFAYSGISIEQIEEGLRKLHDFMCAASVAAEGKN
jgi:aspartate/methionine/tyrosine aminotransferase